MVDRPFDTPTDIDELLLKEIEAEAAQLRFVSEFESKATRQEPLTDAELRYLYELDLPIYQRNRDDYFDYEDEDADRKDRYEKYKGLYRDQVTLLLQREYGDGNVAWLSWTHQELFQNLPEALEGDSDASLVALHLAPRARYTYLEQLQAAGAEVDIPRLVGELDEMHFWGRNAQFIRDNEALLVASDVNKRVILNAYVGDELVPNIPKLLQMGVERDDIRTYLSQSAVEENFALLVSLQFDPAQLLYKCSNAYVAEHFDELYELVPGALQRVMNRHDVTPAERLERALQLHAKGWPIRDHVESIIKTNPLIQESDLQRLVDAGVAANDIVDMLAEEYLYYKIPFLIKNGADRARIQSKLSDYGMVIKRDMLREAGIEVNVAERLQNIDAGTVIALWEVNLRNEERGTTPDELLARFEGELSEQDTRNFLLAGANAQAVVEKMPDNRIALRDFYDNMLQAGVSPDLLWKKTSPVLREFVVVSAVEAEGAVDDESIVKAIQTLGPSGIASRIDRLANTPEHADMIVDALAGAYQLDALIEPLLQKGASAEKLLAQVEARTAFEHYPVLVDAGVDAMRVYEKISEIVYLPKEWEYFTAHGVPLERLHESLTSERAQHYFKGYVEVGVDATTLFELIDASSKETFAVRNIEYLLESGVAADVVAVAVSADAFVRNVRMFAQKGVDSRIIWARFMQRYPHESSERIQHDIRAALATP